MREALHRQALHRQVLNYCVVLICTSTMDLIDYVVMFQAPFLRMQVLTLFCHSGVCRAKAGEGVFTLLQHLSLRTSATQKIMNVSFKSRGTLLRYTLTF